MQYVALLARLNLSVAHCKIQNVWSNHSFNAGKKKALIKVFLKSFCSFNFTIHFFGCHHLTFLQISPNFLQIVYTFFKNYHHLPFCCGKRAADSKQFDFVAVLLQHFFLLLLMQLIALQVLEKCCKWPLSSKLIFHWKAYSFTLFKHYSSRRKK